MSKIERCRKMFGVSKDASLQELKSLYRGFMKDFHPDKFQDSEEAKLAAEEKSKKLIDAYHFLVSIAPETIASTKEQYIATISNASVSDFDYKGTTLRLDFSDGNSYEYYDVPKGVYTKLCNAPSIARFARRHVCENFVYRSTNKLVTTA